MADLQIRAWLGARALAQLRAYGHDVPRIRWDRDGQEASGTCTRCGDGVLLYYDAQPDRCSIEGTALHAECPGGSCVHGWRPLRRMGAAVFECVHCGAERIGGEEGLYDVPCAASGERPPPDPFDTGAEPALPRQCME